MGKAIPTAAEIIKEKLLAIAPEVTPADKKALIDKENYSMSTINGYLKGTIHNVDTAITIYGFLKEKVTSRLQTVNEL